MIELNAWQRMWLRLVEVARPYLISPIGKPCRPRVITAAAADRPKPVMLNRYPRQVIGFGLRLPDMDVCGGPTYHPYLSIVWSKPHGSRRWVRRAS